MTLTTKLIGTGTALLLLTGAGTLAHASDDGSGQPVSVRTAAAEWRPAPGAPATSHDVGSLEDLARSIDPAGLVPPELGRSIQRGPTARIGVLPTVGGALCFHVKAGDVSEHRACGEAFAADGTAVLYTVESGAPTSLIGVVAGDVSAVRVVTADGATHDVPIVDASIWWTAPESSRIASMMTTRAGEQHTDSARFVQPSA